MYNGVAAQQVKGTGLSGYVQRSKATVHSQLSRFRPSAVGEDGEAGLTPANSINPLLAKRSQRENAELERRLEAHKAIRAVRLKVLRYRQDRLTAGVAAVVVDRECAELHRSLMQVAVEQQRELKRADEDKSSERFAAAFGVKTGEAGSAQAFDRVRQDEQRAAAEELRRRTKEEQLSERLKRVRQEEESKPVH